MEDYNKEKGLSFFIKHFQTDSYLNELKSHTNDLIQDFI